MANPITCQGLGFHEYDGDVPDRSEQFVKKRISELTADISKLNSYDKPEGKLAEFELFLVLSALEKELFELRDKQGHLNSAASYVAGWFNAFNMIQKSHTQRSYATIDERVQLITELESKLPHYLEQATENLANVTLSVAATKSSLNYISGYINYYQDELIEFVSLANNDIIIQGWSEVNNFVVEALHEFQAFLEKKLVTASPDFSLGEEKFLAMLKYTEGVDITVDQLLKVGYDDLEKNYAAMLEIASKRGQDVKELIDEIQSDYPDPDEMLEYTRMTSDRARQF
ncbi:MAG: DUF885 family protein, partial [Candidatus Kariarchaeaceae archaeon]